MARQKVPPDAEEIARKAIPVFQRYGIRKAILFGPIARGTHTRRSDVDLILVQETEKRYLERSEGILAELYRAIPARDKELFIYTPSEMEAMGDRPFLKRALSQGRVIWPPGPDAGSSVLLE